MPIDSGDTVWVLISAALVMVMTPAVGFFYGGMAGRKNVISVLMQTFAILALIGVQWVLWGYSLAFGPDKAGLIGGLDWLGLRGVGLEPNVDYAATIPHQAFMIFQAMFAIITPALIVGCFVGRMKFSAFIVFTLLWATIVYDPVAHWVWGIGGWLRSLGALDFAGGTVVHVTAGVSALAASLAIGRRSESKIGELVPHNVPMVLLGAILLWFGWFGFNAGSALGANGLAASAFVVTNTAAAMAALTWVFLSWINTGKVDPLGGATGAVAGLVAITPASGFVSPLFALLIGIGAGVFPYYAIRFRIRRRLDDTLDVWACHGIGGTWGALATGLFASKAVNAAGGDGLFFGNPAQLGVQALAVAVTWVFAFAATFGILKAINVIMGLRVSERAERVGLDLAQYGGEAYNP
ncbi:MAG: ammonium transporter [Chloroflexi bacterium]|nr:ammonium transporter [Chloroflexota bacterium]